MNKELSKIVEDSKSDFHDPRDDIPSIISQEDIDNIIESFNKPCLPNAKMVEAHKRAKEMFS